MEAIKKFFKGLFHLLLIAALCCGIWYFAAGPKTIPAPYIDFGGERIAYTQQHWRTPVFFGYLYKDVKGKGSEEAELGQLEPAQLRLSVPEGYSCSVTLDKEGEHYFSGGVDDFNKQVWDNGSYRMNVDLRKEQDELSDWLQLDYAFSYTVDVRPSAAFSAESAMQGDIITVYVNTGRSDELPTISTDLGKPVFASLGNRNYVSYVPVGFAQTPGEYDIYVSAGGEDFVGHVSVREREYEVQELTIDEEVAASTTGSTANIDYAQKIKPTLFTAEKEIYWSGLFVQPVQGPITTEFGIFRYVNGSEKAQRHTGIDIAAPEGTPVPASNSGKVVYAGDTISTGGSVVIDHGCGLKSFYYHLSSVDVKTGDVVSKGDVIGKVGSTGFATGPHLHFEVKIGEYPVSPWELFDGTSSIYSGPESAGLVM